MSKQEILKKAKQARIDEVEHYQINIDNYKAAIDLIKSQNDSDLIDFCNQLQELLNSSIIEQKKANIMLSVISNQIKE